MENDLVEKFDCIIPLGFYCGLANDLDTLHKRYYSFPFDWIISNFEKTIIIPLENNFSHFFDICDFEQDKDNKNYYFNKKNCFWSYHDFFEDIPIQYSFSTVKKKYLKRIKRFQKFLKKKCLLIRYCYDQNEVLFIKNNLARIKTALCHNTGSKVIFICNDNLDAPSYFYKVRKDPNGNVCSRPLINDKNLSNMIDSISIKKPFIWYRATHFIKLFFTKISYYRFRLAKHFIWKNLTNE